MEFKRKQGLTSIIITHKLNEIIYCADRCTIHRDGSTIETLTKGVDDLSEDRSSKEWLDVLWKTVINQKTM